MTQTSSSREPRTVIARRPLDGPVGGKLAAAVSGHGEITAAIAGHLERDAERAAAAGEEGSSA